MSDTPDDPRAAARLRWEAVEHTSESGLSQFVIWCMYGLALASASYM